MCAIEQTGQGIRRSVYLPAGGMRTGKTIKGVVGGRRRAWHSGTVRVASAHGEGGCRWQRLFALGTYLLIKGRRTYLNLELDLDPEWWPEYDIPIGAPSQSAGTQITNLYDATNQVYRRNFSNGFVLVNPTSSWDGSGVTRTVNLGGSYYRAVTSGGGAVPTSGVPTGTVTYQAVTSVTLPPYTAVVLFNAHP